MTGQELTGQDPREKEIDRIRQQGGGTSNDDDVIRRQQEADLADPNQDAPLPDPGGERHAPIEIDDDTI